MSDDWSLKGTYYIPNDCKYYKEDEIETLRKKLIEDFSSMNRFNVSIGTVIATINKRFGVEE